MSVVWRHRLVLRVVSGLLTTEDDHAGLDLQVTSERIEPPDLHDTTLLSIEVDWPKGAVIVRLRGASDEIHVSAIGLRLATIPRFQPWGPSVSVNTAQLMTVEGGVTRLVVEMQSGDELVIEADAVYLD
jgi:hypothetical protein